MNELDEFSAAPFHLVSIQGNFVNVEKKKTLLGMVLLKRHLNNQKESMPAGKKGRYTNLA